jgi:hypothetical protein
MKRLIDLGDHPALMRRTVQLRHVGISMAVGGNDTDVEFQRQGKDAPVLMRLQAARGHEAFGLQNRTGDAKSVPPVTSLRLEFDPIPVLQIIEVDHPDVEFLQDRKDPFLFHDFSRERPASLSHADGFGPHPPKLLHQRRQGIVVRGTRRGVGRVEIGFDKDMLSFCRLNTQRFQGSLDPTLAIRRFRHDHLAYGTGHRNTSIPIDALWTLSGENVFMAL